MHRVMNKPIASQVIAESMIALPMKERAEFLREVIAHAAAGLVVIESGRDAAAACYRAGHAVIQRYG